MPDIAIEDAAPTMEDSRLLFCRVVIKGGQSTSRKATEE
jgi:hypothetical protein